MVRPHRLSDSSCIKEECVAVVVARLIGLVLLSLMHLIVLMQMFPYCCGMRLWQWKSRPWQFTRKSLVELRSHYI